MSSCKSDGNGVWKVVSTKLVLDQKPWIKVWDDHVLLPNGAEIEHYVRTETRSYSMCFALTSDGLVPVIKQYKHGAGGCFYELPAGYLEPGENPMACAKRELLEETGLGGGKWERLASLIINSNRGDARAHLFLAIGVTYQAPPHPEETEILEVIFFAPEELAKMVWSGVIETLPSSANVILAAERLGLHL